MKITWKIFFSSVFVMTVTFCAAGYFLIAAFFESGYERSVNSAIDLSRMFLLSFGNYMIRESDGEGLQDAVKVIADDVLTEDVRVYIADEKGKSVYADESIDGVGEEHTEGISYILVVEGADHYIRIRNRIQVGDVWYYAVTDHNVTALFAERENELRIYNRFLFCLVLVNGLISWFLARFIVRPIRKVSQGAGRIAGGDLTYRLSIRSEDEIGAMAQSFNRMADSLARQIAELEDVAERQEEFIGSFAHELKTPLTSIIGYADLLRSNRQTEEDRFICANYIFQEGKRLESLSLRLLELTVLGQLKLKLRRVSIRELFEGLEGIMAPVLQKEQMKLVWEAEEQEVCMEPELVQSIFMNLLDNARKSMRSGGMIRISGSREGKTQGEYVIVVQDDGSGIPEEKLGRITDAFYMVDKSRSRQQGGAGLGLSICKKIMDLHGGRILFESEVGVGTSVRLVFPLDGVGNSGEEENEK